MKNTKTFCSLSLPQFPLKNMPGKMIRSLLSLCFILLFLPSLARAQDTCFQKTTLDIVETTDSAGNCVFKATANALTAEFIIGYQWSGTGTAVFDNTSAGSDVHYFTLPPGGSAIISVTVYAVNLTFKDTVGGPCCSETMTAKISCDALPAPPCIDSTTSHIQSIYNGYDSLGCKYTCNAIAIAGAGWTIYGYQWQSLPISSSSTYNTTVPLGTSLPVNVTVYATDSLGDTCSYYMSTILNCTPDSTSCFDTSGTYLSVSSHPGFGGHCIFTLTAHEATTPGWTLLGYEWGYSGISSSSTYTHTLSSGTGYSVPLTIFAINSYGDTCTVSFSVTLNCDSGVGTYHRQAHNVIHAHEAGTSIMLYPNPTSNEVFISATEGTVIKDIDVLDVNGKKMSHYTYDSATKTSISMDTFPPGMYVVRVNNQYNVPVIKK